MDISSTCQLSLEFGISSIHGSNEKFQNWKSRSKSYLLGTNFSSVSLQRCCWSKNLSKRTYRRVCTIPFRNHQFECHCFLNPGPSLDATFVKNATSSLVRSFNCLQGSPLMIKLASAVGIVVFAIWGLGPLVQQSRAVFLGKSDSNWKRTSTYEVAVSYIQPLLLWTGAIFICRALDPMILPSESGQIVKQRLLNFIRSLSTVLAFAHCLSSVIQQAQKFFTETNDPTNTRNMGFQFAGRALYTAVWVAAVSLLMELLGFSTQKWITAGGLGTVLLTLAGREIFTNFLSSVMIHATRPFVLNEWIQTKIEGYEVSGTVEHVGWWSPTIIRGDDREAVHIPNHKFTVNVVRNLSQKTHWRIKTHLAISHLDVGKINNIVADMRKVLAKNPQVEQQKLHRRVFLDNISSENQALLEAILLDLLRVITHHRARLATPIRTVQKIFTDADLDGVPFSDSVFTQGATSNRPLLLIEPSYKITGEDKTKTQARSARVNAEEDSKATPRIMHSTPDGKVLDAKSEETESTDYNTREVLTLDARDGQEFGDNPKVGSENAKSPSDPKLSTIKSKNDIKSVEISSPNANKPPNSTHQQAQASVTKPSLEENIVLGVALEGSKRTLPIEEDTVPPSNPEDLKELAALRKSNGPAMAEKEKSDTNRSDIPVSSPAGDQLDQQD